VRKVVGENGSELKNFAVRRGGWEWAGGGWGGGRRFGRGERNSEG